MYLFNLHFFYPHLLSGDDVHIVASAVGAGRVVGSEREFRGAAPASPPGRNCLDDEERPLKGRFPGAGLEAEFYRLGDHAAQFAYLQSHRDDAPPGGGALADINNTLRYGQFMH